MSGWHRLADEPATLRAGRALAAAVGDDGGVITLEGELGAGKTTLVRGLLAGFGHAGRVKSPTYTLLEPYELDGRSLFHLDLYRLATPAEVAPLDLDGLLGERDLLLVEWPERGGGLLPPADLALGLRYAGTARELKLRALAARAERWQDRFGRAWEAV